VEENVAFQDVTIFPSQVTSELSIQCDRFDALKGYTIYTQDGKQILNGSFNSTRTMLSLENLASGMYFIQIQRKDGSAFNKKFIKL
jgi:hypothetical protein